MNFTGLLVGLSAFLIIIGLFHPLVIKAEYYRSCLLIFLEYPGSDPSARACT